MRVAVFTEPGQIDIQQHYIPEPGSGDVLVRVSSVGVCGSDSLYLRDGRVGGFVVESPLVLGHEAAGTIVGVGPGVSQTRNNLYPDMRCYGTPPVGGAFAEYVTIGSAFAYTVPDSISDEAAALCEPLSVGVALSAKPASKRPPASWWRAQVQSGSRSSKWRKPPPFGRVCMLSHPQEPSS